MTEPKPFNIKLSVEDRATAEKLRASMGLRSQADVFRVLLARAAAGHSDTKQALQVAQAEAFKQAAKPKVQTSKPPAFKPRLKGEWKAP